MVIRPRLVAAALTVFVTPIALGTLGTPRVSAEQGVVLGTNQPSGSATASSAASSAASSTATFEVASVKPNKSGDGRVMMSMPPTGRITATNIPVLLLLRQAFNVQPFQIIGSPNWLASDRFDIVAKAPDGTAPELFRPMMRNLLADRFKLKAHMETREMPIYALILVRSDGKLGPNLAPTTVDCEAIARGRRGGGPPPAPPQPGERVECSFMIGPGHINAGGMPMAELARSLSQFVNRIVVDKTGLNAKYDFQLTYTPEGRGLPGLPGGPPVGVDLPAADPNGASLFTAVQEQLGLKLDSQKGPVEVLVIESIEQPTAD